MDALRKELEATAMGNSELKRARDSAARDAVDSRADLDTTAKDNQALRYEF